MRREQCPGNMCVINIREMQSAENCKEGEKGTKNNKQVITQSNVSIVRVEAQTNWAAFKQFASSYSC